MNMKVIKKNQLAILVIALMLVTAGYLNYTSNDTDESISASSIVNENSVASIGDATLVNSDDLVENYGVEENLGQTNTIANTTNDTNTIETSTKLIDSQSQTNDYFVTSRLQRDTMYSQMLETYTKILESTTVSSEQKAVSTEEINKINAKKNAIMITENLIKTKGFEECVIFNNDNSISIVVKSEELTPEQIAQIQNIVSREMNAEIENIHISNK